MAEKEQRILCIETDEKIVECGYGDFYSTISRKESIERMAKANWIATVCAKNQCVPADITKEQWDEEWKKLRIDYKKVYYAGAEAALNALLEEK